MLIEYLKLRNFLIFEDVDIDFTEVNLTSITGKWKSNGRRSNGAGKSALLEAIPYALFGSHRSKVKTGIIKEGSKRCVVEIEFVVGETKIKIYRARDRDGTSAAKIWVNGECTGQLIKVVDEVVEERLGVGRELFELIYFFRQDEQFGFVNAGPGERKAYLAKIFDFSALEQCLVLAKVRYKKAIEVQQKAEGAVDTLQQQLNTLPPRDSLVNVVLESHEGIDGLLVCKYSREVYLQDVELDISESDELFAQFDQETKEVLDEIADLHKEFQGNLNKIANLEISVNTKGNQLQSLKESQKLLDKDLGDVDLSIDVATWMSRITEKSSKRDAVLGDIAKCEYRLSLDNKTIHESNSLAGEICPKCYQVVKMDHIEQIVRDAKKSVDYQSSILVASRFDKATIDNALDLLREKKKWRESADINITRRDERKRLIDVCSTELNTRRDQLEELKARQSKIQERRAILSSNVNVGGASVGRNKLGWIVDAFKNKVIFQRDLKRWEEDQIRYEKQISTAEAKLEEYDRIQSLIDSAKSEVARAAKLVAISSELVGIFGRDGIQAIIIENVIGIIEQFANDTLVQMQTRFVLSLRTVKDTKAGNLKETLEIVVYDNGKERAFETYSGGERTLINLAIRLSLSRVISSMHGVVMQSLFLDEVLAALDEVNREEAIKVVSFLSHSFRQVFVISHTDMIKDIIPGCILVERFDNQSKVRIIDGGFGTEREVRTEIAASTASTAS